jgi:hypothetical protein
MKKAMLFLATLLLSQSMVVSASSFPNPINTIDTFLNDATYFNGHTELNAIDFGGLWQYTALGFEAGNTNEVSIVVNGAATFSTADTSNFGDMELVDFNTDGLFFSDTINGPANVALDPFNGPSMFFRVFELTADTNALSFLANSSLVLEAGTIIVGFGDGLGDSDFDDLILALKPVPVPAALFLFAPALLGFFGLRRKASVTA